MLRSSYYHNQRHDYDEYPDPGDIIEVIHVHYQSSINPYPSGRLRRTSTTASRLPHPALDVIDSLFWSYPNAFLDVRFCDSPPMNQITVNELVSDDSEYPRNRPVQSVHPQYINTSLVL